MSKNLKKDHHYDVIGSEYYSQGELWWVSISGEVWDVADKHGDLDRVKELAICELMYDHHEDLGMELLKYGNVWRRCQVVCEWLPLHSLEVKRLLAGVSVIPTPSDSFVKILRVKKVNGLDVKVPHVPRCGPSGK